MKAADLLVVIIAVCAGLAFLVFLFGLFVSRRAGINRKEMLWLKRDNKRQRKTLYAIEDAVSGALDIDSPLAANVRTILRESNQEREIL